MTNHYPKQWWTTSFKHFQQAQIKNGIGWFIRQTTKCMHDSGPYSFTSSTSNPKSRSRGSDSLKYIFLLTNIDTMPVFVTTVSVYKPTYGAVLWFSFVVIATTKKLTLYILFFQQIHKHVFEIYIISSHWNHTGSWHPPSCKIMTFLDCWWIGDAMHQGINNLSIDLVKLHVKD